MYYGNLKPKRGFTKQYRVMMEEIVQLQSDLNHIVVWGDAERVKELRASIKDLYTEMLKISIQL